jgi:3-hydroxyisobutyrate dehydrogenase-like beta-hydroxyacid dehydrogenase
MKVAIVGGTGAFGRALAKRLAEIGQRRRRRRLARRRARAGDGRGARRPAGRNQDVVRDVDLVVLAVKSNATLETATELADAIGKTRCSALRATFASPTQACCRAPPGLARGGGRAHRAGPVASGFPVVRRANVLAGDPGDALICGEDSERRRSRSSSPSTSARAASTSARSRTRARSRG